MKEIILALSLFIQIATTSAASADGANWEVQLLTRTPSGEIVSLPTDSSEFGIWCWGFNRSLQAQDVEIIYNPGPPTSTFAAPVGWYVELTDDGYDYALFCQSDGMDWYPAVIEDHDIGPGAVVILDQVNSQYIVLNRDMTSQATCRLTATGETVIVPLLVYSDIRVNAHRQSVQVPQGCSLLKTTW